MRGVRGIDLGAYARGIAILFRFPQVMLGPLLTGVLQVLLHTVMPGGDGAIGAANTGLAGLFSQLLTAFGIAIAIVVADEAWRFNRAPFDDAWEQARRRGGDIIVCAFGVGLVTYVASLVGSIVPGFGSIVLFLVATFFMMYALPAAAIGGIPGFGSLQISVDRARANIPQTILLTIVYFLAIAVAPVLLLTFLEPLLVMHTGLTSGPWLSLIAVAIEAPLTAYVGIMLAKAYESVSYGRSR